MNTKDYFIYNWLSEAKTTVNALKAMPADKIDYRCNPKSRSAKEIMEHIVPHSNDIIEALESGVVNHALSQSYKSIDDACASYTSNNSKIEQLIKSTDEKTWDEKIIPFNVMGQKVFEMPLRDICFVMLFDTIHHRGQLSTYYRAMGARNPAIYGPTAEMDEEMTEAAKQ